jgi:hypothetical protein
MQGYNCPFMLGQERRGRARVRLPACARVMPSGAPSTVIAHYSFSGESNTGAVEIGVGIAPSIHCGQ